MKSIGTSPLAWAVLVVGLIGFAIVAIVRNVTAPVSDYAGMAAAASQSISAGVYASSDLPVYEPIVADQRPTRAELPTAPIRTDLPIDPPWNTTYRDDTGNWWVYVGAWVNCQFVDTINLTYAAGAGDPALAAWGEMAPRKQQDAAELCQGATAVTMPIVAPTVAPLPTITPLPTVGLYVVPTAQVVTIPAPVTSGVVTHIKIDEPNQDKFVLISGTYEWIPCANLTNTLLWVGPDGPGRAVWEGLDVGSKAGAVEACIRG